MSGDGSVTSFTGQDGPGVVARTCFELCFPGALDDDLIDADGGNDDPTNGAPDGGSWLRGGHGVPRRHEVVERSEIEPLGEQDLVVVFTQAGADGEVEGESADRETEDDQRAPNGADHLPPWLSGGWCLHADRVRKGGW